MPHETVQFDRFLGQTRKILEMIEKEGRCVRVDKTSGKISGAPDFIDAIATAKGLHHQTDDSTLNRLRIDMLSRIATLRADVESLEHHVQGLPIEIRIGKGLLGDDLGVKIKR